MFACFSVEISYYHGESAKLGSAFVLVARTLRTGQGCLLFQATIKPTPRFWGRRCTRLRWHSFPPTRGDGLWGQGSQWVSRERVMAAVCLLFSLANLAPGGLSACASPVNLDGGGGGLWMLTGIATVAATLAAGAHLWPLLTQSFLEVCTGCSFGLGAI